MSGRWQGKGRRSHKERSDQQWPSQPNFLSLPLNISLLLESLEEGPLQPQPSQAIEAAPSGLRTNSSVLFEMEPEGPTYFSGPNSTHQTPQASTQNKALYKLPSTGHGRTISAQLPSALTPGPADQLLSLVLPSDDLSHLLQQQLRRLRPTARGTSPQSIEDLATDLLSLGYLIQARDGSNSTSSSGKPGDAPQQAAAQRANPLRSLRHRFLVCTGWHLTGGSREAVLLEEPLIVEPRFKEQFLIANPTRAYEELLQALPVSFVGNLGRLKAAVDLLGREIAEAFKQQKRSLPPWRTSEALLSKWAPAQMEDLAKLMRHAASMPPAVTPHYEHVPTPQMGAAASHTHFPITASTSPLPLYVLPEVPSATISSQSAADRSSNTTAAPSTSTACTTPAVTGTAQQGAAQQDAVQQGPGSCVNCDSNSIQQPQLQPQPQVPATPFLMQAHVMEQLQQEEQLLTEALPLQVLPLLPQQLQNVRSNTREDQVCLTHSLPAVSTEAIAPRSSSSGTSASSTNPASAMSVRLSAAQDTFSEVGGAGPPSSGRGLNLAKGLGLARSNSNSLNLRKEPSQEFGNAAVFRICQEKQRSLQRIPTSRTSMSIWQSQEQNAMGQGPHTLSVVRSQDLNHLTHHHGPATLCSPSRAASHDAARPSAADQSLAPHHQPRAPHQQLLQASPTPRAPYSARSSTSQAPEAGVHELTSRTSGQQQELSFKQSCQIGQGLLPFGTQGEQQQQHSPRHQPQAQPLPQPLPHALPFQLPHQQQQQQHENLLQQLLLLRTLGDTEASKPSHQQVQFEQGQVQQQQQQQQHPQPSTLQENQAHAAPQLRVAQQPQPPPPPQQQQFVQLDALQPSSAAACADMHAAPLSPLKFPRVSSNDLRQQVQQTRNQTKSALATALRTQDKSPLKVSAAATPATSTPSKPPGLLQQQLGGSKAAMNSAFAGSGSSAFMPAGANDVAPVQGFQIGSQQQQQQQQPLGEQLQMKTMRPLQEVLRVRTVKWGAATGGGSQQPMQIPASQQMPFADGHHRHAPGGSGN